MLEMESTNVMSYFVIFGVTENCDQFYSGFNFPRVETMKALGADHGDRLVMISKEE